MFNRIKQVINYIFTKPRLDEIEQIRDILSPPEYEIFLNMDEYDKIHCLGVYREMTKDEILGKDPIYLKFALLHDCGKEDINLFRRIKKVIFQDELLEHHPILGYEKLKEINLEVAKLIKNHHNKSVDEKMKRFQEIDDRN